MTYTPRGYLELIYNTIFGICLIGGGGDIIFNTLDEYDIYTSRPGNYPLGDFSFVCIWEGDGYYISIYLD